MFLRCRFAVGFRDCVMGGASVIIGIVIIGESSITLCCFSCSSFLTLCSLADGLGGNHIVPLHVNGTFGGRVIDAVRIGSRGSCVYAMCWIACSSILDINGTAPGVLFCV